MASRAADVPVSSDASLVVLAGGDSRRMGRPKHALPVGGVTLLEWIIARLAPAFAETVVSGAPAPPGTRAVADGRHGAGPLAGIEAALLAMRGDRAFVVAVDMPNVSPRLAAALLARLDTHDAVVPRVSGRPEPTCAAYARSAVPKIGAFLETGERRATAALERLDVVFADEDELRAAGVAASELADLDTAADYEAFLASLRT